jgi:hypothetical protein
VLVPVLVGQEAVAVPMGVLLGDQECCAYQHQSQRDEELHPRCLPEDHEREQGADKWRTAMLLRVPTHLLGSCRRRHPQY